MQREDVEWKAATARTFDDRAESWRRRGPPAPQRVDAVLAELGCAPGGLVLDVGCGSGNWSIALARHGYRVRGVDLSPRMIAQAREAAREHGLAEEAVGFAVGDAERVAAPAAAFDAIICLRVLDFTPRPGMALADFRRVLKPGGRLLVSTLGVYSPVKRESWRRFLPGNTDARIGNGILPLEVEALLTELGWRITRRYPEFLPTAAGDPNPYEELGRGLSDPVLQGVIASAWTVVAVKSATEDG